MQYSQEHLKTVVYAKFGGQIECMFKIYFLAFLPLPL